MRGLIGVCRIELFLDRCKRWDYLSMVWRLDSLVRV